MCWVLDSGLSVTPDHQTFLELSDGLSESYYLGKKVRVGDESA